MESEDAPVVCDVIKKKEGGKKRFKEQENYFFLYERKAEAVGEIMKIKIPSHEYVYVLF